MTECVVEECRRESHPDYTVCLTCLDILPERIRAIPALFERLSPMPKTPNIAEVIQKPKFESKSPADDQAIMLRDARSVDGPIWVMQQWQVRFWMLKTIIGRAMEPETDLERLSERLTLHWPFWARLNEAHDFYSDMSRIWTALMQSVGDLPSKPVIGLCTDCGTRVFYDEGKKVQCSACDKAFDHFEVQAIARAMHEQTFRVMPHWKTLVQTDDIPTGDLTGSD